MKSAKSFGLHTWSTPLTIGSFILMVVTGVLMFFDVVPGYLSFAHEWFSWLFLIGAGGHILLHSRSFTRHLQTRWGRANVILFTLALVASMFSFGRITAPQLKWPISNALVDAPLSALAEVTRRDRTDLLNSLQAQGILATPEQNIRELAAQYDVDEFHMLGLIFLSDSP